MPARYSAGSEKNGPQLQRLLDISPRRDEAVLLLERENARLLRLCAQMEAMADRLPAAFKAKRTLRLLQLTELSLKRHTAIQEQIIFPTIRERAGRQIDRLLKQCEYEHASDGGLLIEILERAINPGHSSDRTRVEAFGCLLRHFFEGKRRHLEWEKQALEPFMKQPRANSGNQEK
ncbi:MAG: hemerythrin domain-containing protein [Rhodomicrobium sp.]